MKPYDWSVVEEDPIPDKPKYPLLTWTLLVSIVAIAVVAYLIANRAAPSSAAEPSVRRLTAPVGVPGSTAQPQSGASHLLLAPATVDSVALAWGAPSALSGTATWYCGAGSPCTRGFDPSDLVAAIDPTTGIERGTRLRVTHGSRSVTVRIVDVCACPGPRVIDLSRLAFSRLASPSRGVIPVTISGARPAPTLPATDTEETP